MKWVKYSWLPLWKRLDRFTFKPIYVDGNGSTWPKEFVGNLPKVRKVEYQEHRIFNICRLVFVNGYDYPINPKKAEGLYKEYKNS